MNEVNTGAFAVNYKSGFQSGIFKPLFPKLSASHSSLPRVVCIFQTFRQASESAQCRQRRWGRFYLAWEKGRFWGHLAIESFTTHRAQLSLCVRVCIFFFLPASAPQWSEPQCQLLVLYNGKKKGLQLNQTTSVFTHDNLLNWYAGSSVQ